MHTIEVVDGELRIKFPVAYLVSLLQDVDSETAVTVNDPNALMQFFSEHLVSQPPFSRMMEDMALEVANNAHPFDYENVVYDCGFNQTSEATVLVIRNVRIVGTMPVLLEEDAEWTDTPAEITFSDEAGMLDYFADAGRYSVEGDPASYFESAIDSVFTKLYEASPAWVGFPKDKPPDSTFVADGDEE